MAEFLKLIWAQFQKISFFIGDMIATVALVAFYFSVFLLFALPVRVFTDYLGLKSSGSAWIKRGKNFNGIGDFQKE